MFGDGAVAGGGYADCCVVVPEELGAVARSDDGDAALEGDVLD